MQLDQLLGQWIDWLLSLPQQAMLWFQQHSFHKDISQLIERLKDGWNHAFEGLHWIAVCLAFLSDVLKPLSRRSTKGLALGEAGCSAASYAGIQYQIVPEEIGAIIFVFSLSLAILSFTMLMLQHAKGEKGEKNGALAAFFPAIERMQERLWIIEKKIDDIREETTKQRKDQEEESARAEARQAEPRRWVIEAACGGVPRCRPWRTYAACCALVTRISTPSRPRSCQVW